MEAPQLTMSLMALIIKIEVPRWFKELLFGDVYIYMYRASWLIDSKICNHNTSLVQGSGSRHVIRFLLTICVGLGGWLTNHPAAFEF